MDVKTTGFSRMESSREVVVINLKDLNDPRRTLLTSYRLKESSYGPKAAQGRGLQVSQSPGGIFINQAKYALETLKKYGMDLSDPVDTPMVDRLKLTRISWGFQLPIRDI
ncbi:hypothetical protein Tco_0369801 [Tanacetum coccineum]